MRKFCAKGEVTLVIAPPSLEAGEADVEAALAEALKILPPAKAAAEIARRFNLPKRDLYARALAVQAGRAHR
jgi:16S rRNA (cytidine1402-2'-O)-methyltransferase